jgi:hypothetical protein
MGDSAGAVEPLTEEFAEDDAAPDAPTAQASRVPGRGVTPRLVMLV